MLSLESESVLAFERLYPVVSALTPRKEGTKVCDPDMCIYTRSEQCVGVHALCLCLQRVHDHVGYGCIGQTCTGHTYIGHNCVGQSHIGQNLNLYMIIIMIVWGKAI